MLTLYSADVSSVAPIFSLPFDHKHHKALDLVKEEGWRHAIASVWIKVKLQRVQTKS